MGNKSVTLGTYLLGNCPSEKLTFWETYLLRNFLLGNWPSGKLPTGKLPSGKNPLGNYSWGIHPKIVISSMVTTLTPPPSVAPSIQIPTIVTKNEAVGKIETGNL